MSTTPTTSVRIALADAQPGDQVWQAGAWVPVAAFHIFGSRRDLVKLVFASGGTQSMPVSHCPTITRTVLAGSWSAPSFSGRGTRTPHYITQPGRVAVCGRHMGTGILRTHTPYLGDQRCQRCQSWVERNQAQVQS